jgi:cell wall-associated NlpC family hydrolase
VYGDVIAVNATTNDHYEVQFPDGRKGFVSKTQSLPYGDWKSSRQPSSDNFINTAKQLMGIPYLWGGTSFKGVDCSGFTKTVYFVNGLVLPRDASQQVMIGEEIDTKDGWQNLQPGDLLFFGSKARDTLPERVVHVGMWIGNNQFIHASGKVRISSFDSSSLLFDESELKRFLRAKRISPKNSLIDLTKNELF